jgi:hypothetical protein
LPDHAAAGPLTRFAGSPPGALPLPPRLAPITIRRLQAAYRRVRMSFGQIGVQVVCAASDQPLALILDRIERLRRLRRVH